ncbi:FCD domain-containing protein [Nonomuraea sp. N2-4H]|uniref:FCD domain-containing protein n=1 Tax=Nonomuraea sp. N2-4H TaxID=3128898 RepID=UPI0032448CA1
MPDTGAARWRQIAEARALTDQLDRLWTAGELARRWSGAVAPGRDAVAEHRALEEAALARDADRAAALLREHVLRTVETLTGASRTPAH